MAIDVAKLSEFTGEFGTAPGTGEAATGTRAAPECWRCPGPGWCTR